MLQSLLADRFKLVLHKDTKPVPAYILTVSGTPKLKVAETPASKVFDRRSPWPIGLLTALVWYGHPLWLAVLPAGCCTLGAIGHLWDDPMYGPRFLWELIQSLLGFLAS